MDKKPNFILGVATDCYGSIAAGVLDDGKLVATHYVKRDLSEPRRIRFPRMVAIFAEWVGNEYVSPNTFVFIETPLTGSEILAILCNTEICGMIKQALYSAGIAPDMIINLPTADLINVLGYRYKNKNDQLVTEEGKSAIDYANLPYVDKRLVCRAAAVAIGGFKVLSDSGGNE